MFPLRKYVEHDKTAGKFRHIMAFLSSSLRKDDLVEYVIN